ncbi:MAG TPA: 3'-5' exonuclease, partial [Candidatus Saccharimonadales bacterium]|nr:3'-5' exonuclease [Candidatus Saccharimonadales bacterium]
IQDLLRQLDLQEPQGDAAAAVRSLATELGLTGQKQQGSIGTAMLQLENLAARFADLAAFLHHMDSLAGQAFFDPAADAITLSTIHSAKGLEFRHVLVAGCNDGVLPGKRAVAADDLAEERRLFYVAITRARDSLLLLCSRQCDGKPASPSSFLKPLQLSTETDSGLAEIERRRQRVRQKRAQGRLF